MDQNDKGISDVFVSNNNYEFNVSGTTDPVEKLRDGYTIRFVPDDATVERISSRRRVSSQR